MNAIFRQRNANRVANPIGQQRTDPDRALDARIFSFARFGHAEMNWIIPVRPFLIQPGDEQAVGVDHHLRVARLHRENERVIIEIARNPREFERALHHAKGRVTVTIHNAIGKRAVVGADAHSDAALLAKIDKMGDYKPEIVYEDAGIVEVDPRDDAAIAKVNAERVPQLVTVKDDVDLALIAAFRLLAAKLQPRHPILLKDTLGRSSGNDEARMTNDERSSNDPMTKEQPSDSGHDSSFVIPSSLDIRHSSFLHTLLTAATNIGSLLCDGIGDAILVQGEEVPGQSLRLSYNILQAAGSRIFKTDYVACPSCGRTLFNLQTTTAKIKAATLHLKGVKIAIMGCIVNGPGEMADADFGYVGGAPGKVNLYVGKTPVKFNIPEAEAVDRLQHLIREHGKWIDPVPASSEAIAAN